MAENKTKQTAAGVPAFLAGIEDERRRADAKALCALMQELTGEAPAMWGSSMIGFGTHHYVYESGREGDTFVVGFSPRKAAIVLYLNDGFEGREALLARLGKHTTGKGCLYVKRLTDIDEGVLRELVADSAAKVRARSRPET